MSASPLRQEHRILLVDGNREAHQFLRKALNGDGDRDALSGKLQEDYSREAIVTTKRFDIGSASEGREGVTMVKGAIDTGRPFSVAFVDARMGGAIVEMSKADPDLQIVLCTEPSDFLWKAVASQLGPGNVVILRRPFEAFEAEQLAQTLAQKWALARQSRRPLNTAQSKRGETLCPNGNPFHAFFSSISKGFILSELVFDREHEPSNLRILEVNAVFEAFTNLRREELVGKMLRQVLTTKDAGWIRTCGQVALTGEAAHFEHPIEANGRYFEATAFSPSAGKVACVLSDITARRRMEHERQLLLDELHHEHKLLVATLNQIPAGIIIAEVPSGRILVTNLAMTRIFGKGADFEQGLNAFAGFQAIKKDGQPCTLGDWPVVRTARTGARVVDEVLRVEQADGSMRAVLFSSSPVFDEQGQLVAVLGMAVEFTEKSPRDRSHRA